MQSVAKTHPTAQRYCFLTDTDDSVAKEFSSEFTTIPISALNLPSQEAFLFQYNILELNTAIKPWAFSYLGAKGHRTVCYIDPDILVYTALTEVDQLLTTGSRVVLTPHLLAPMSTEGTPSELDIRRTGVYNLGFLALLLDQNSEHFLRWWKGKLARDCVIDLAAGIFVDQSWLDFAPTLFQGVSILRHPGYNVAYWNIAERHLSASPTGITVNDEPLRFFHYSGFDYRKPIAFSRHQNRFTLESLPKATAECAKRYGALLLDNGAEDFSNLTYGLSTFQNGEKIPDVLRVLYRKDEGVRRLFGENPFGAPQSLLHPFAPGHPLLRHVSIAMYAIWFNRVDLQDAFPLRTQADINSYLIWFQENAAGYYSKETIQLHNALFQPIAPSDKATPTTHPTNVSARSGLALRRLYESALLRQPDPSGFSAYLAKCRSYGGLLAVRRDLLQSAEARTLPRPLMRRALSLISLHHAWLALRGGPRSHLESPSPQPGDGAISKKPSQNRLTTLHEFSLADLRGEDCGAFSFDADREAAGIWISKELTIPVPPAASGTKILLEGTPALSNLRKAGEPIPQILQLYLGQKLIDTIVISNDSPFSTSFVVPSIIPVGSELSIISNGAFVPQEIGLGADQRTLAWRCQSLKFDEIYLINCRAERPFLPTDFEKTLPGVNVVGYVTSEHGVGQVSRLLAKSLKSVDIDYSCIDVGHQTDTPKKNLEIFSNAKAREYPIDIVCVNADQSVNTFDFLRNNELERPTARVGIWHWEQTELPQQVENAFSLYDEIWAPSTFVQSAISISSPIPVVKIPHCVSLPAQSLPNRSRFSLPEGLFLALLVFDFDSYSYRKNPEAAISAFRIAAQLRSDCGLIVKTTNAKKYPSELAKLSNWLSGLPNVFMIDGFLSENESIELKRCADCLISLHRAEGFGLNLVEMMALGKPVVATGWSGNMEFMDTHNSLPVNYQLKPLPENIGPYRAGLHWAEADTEHAAKLLLKIIDDTSARLEIGRRARSHIEAELNPTKIGQLVQNRLIRLQRRLSRSRCHG